MSRQRGARGLIRETKIPMQELKPKVQGGAYMRERAYYGILQYLQTG